MLERYRYLVNAAPLETIERATLEMLTALAPADAERIRYRLDQSPELHAAAAGEGPPSERLARFAAQAEKRRPGALERAVRAESAPARGEDLGLLLATALLGTASASAFFSQLETAASVVVQQTEADADPDFSEEFGYESGYAGGSGFEGVEFDRWI